MSFSDMYKSKLAIDSIKDGRLRKELQRMWDINDKYYLDNIQGLLLSGAADEKRLKKLVYAKNYKLGVES